MAVVFSFINEDASKEKILTPTITKVVDTEVYRYPEFPDFSIHVKGNCDISIGYWVDKFSTLDGKLLVIDSKISVQHIKLKGNVLFDNTTINLLEADIEESDFINTSMEGGFIYSTKTKFAGTTVAFEGGSVRNSEFVNCTFKFMGLDSNGAKVNQTTILAEGSNFTANFFGDVSDINLNWDKKDKTLDEFIACIGVHPEMSSKSNLFGIYRKAFNSGSIVGFSTLEDSLKNRLTLEYIYLNGTLNSLVDGKSILNLGVK